MPSDSSSMQVEKQLLLQNAQLASIQTTIITLLSQRDPHELLQGILERAGKLLGTHHGYVYLADPTKQKLTCAVGVGVFQKDVGSQATMGLGIAGCVWKTHEPVVVDEYDRWEHRVPSRPKGRISAIVGIPLIADQHLLGVLGIAYDASTQQPFGERELDLLTQFAHLASIALQNARLFEDAQRRAREAETLREAGAVVAGTLSQEEAISLILSQLQRVIPHDSASVQLLHGDQLIIVGGQGSSFAEQLLGKSFQIPGNNPNTEVMTQRRPLALPDVHDMYGGVFQAIQIRSWMGVPLIVRGRIIGMLTVDKIEANYFTEDHIRLTSAFADQVAIAIENANLFSSAQQEIAERRRAEEQLRQAKEEAEAAARTKSVFLATMSHEIRTPMNGVLGLADVLLDTPLNADQRQIIEMIRISGDGLLRVIDDILDFSKIEAGRLEIEHRPFDLRQCFKAAVDIVRPRASEKGLTLIAHLDPSAPARLLGDPIRLQQIMINLLGNAIKFTERGEVELTMIYERLKQAPVQYRIFCAVRDTGIGVPPEHMPHLFQSFSQGDASMTRRYGGTGLGLAICKLLCELMGGEIWVESAPGEGSIFSFTVTVDAAEQPDDAIAQAAPAVDGRSLAERLPLRLLVVEDHPVNQRVVTLMLQRLGYHAEVVGNGREALERLSAQAYDLVLMDMQMPDMDGLETTRHLRARDPAAQRPIVIALTANAMQGDRERCLAAGMNDYLSKPIRQDELRRMLERWGGHLDALQPPAEREFQTASPVADQVLDLTMLAEMRATGALDELIALFHAETPGLLDSIRDAISAADYQALRNATHTLRGSSSYLGATGLVAHAEALEQAARAEDLSQAPALLAALEHAYQHVVAALQKL